VSELLSTQRLGTVLVIDDDIDTRETVRDVLAAEGYTVVCAQSAEELIAGVLEADGPRVALVDWAMPNMTGEEIVEHMRQHPDPRLRTCPVVIFSACRPPRVAGAVAQLDKPFTLTQLVDTVEQTIA
jgi:CheY-like chemotaxis protein